MRKSKLMVPGCLLLIFMGLQQVNGQLVKKQVLTVPATTEYTHIDTSGKSVLASGRYVTPAGTTIQISHDPFGIALSPDGSKAVTLHNGVFTIIDNTTLKN